MWRQSGACLVSAVFAFVSIQAHAVQDCATQGNRAPKAADYTREWPSQPIKINVVAGSSDPDGDPLTLIDVGSAGPGGTSSKFDSQQVQFTPAANVTGAQFGYTISDGKGGLGYGMVYVGNGVPRLSLDVVPSCNALLCDFAMLVSPSYEAIGARFDWSVTDPGDPSRNVSRTDYKSPTFNVTLRTFNASYPVHVTAYSTSGIRVTADFNFTPIAPTVCGQLFVDSSKGRAIRVSASACPGTSISTQSYSVKYVFGDGTEQGYDTSHGEGELSPDLKQWHWYTSPGIYSVALVVTPKGGGAVSTFARAVQVSNLTPQPAMKTPVAEGSRTYRFEYDPYATIDDGTDNTRLTYSWSFGDGTYADATSTQVTHQYAAGDYVVTLTATDEFGAAGQTTASIHIDNTAPWVGLGIQCQLTSAGTPAASGRDCNASASVYDSDSPMKDYRWTTEGQSWTTYRSGTWYRFASDGRKVVQLVATDSAGSSTTISRVVYVDTSPRSEPLAFYALPPCRAYNSVALNQPLTSNNARTIPLTNCEIPTDAVAAEVNVTALQASGAGHLLAGAAGMPLAPLPILNYNANDARVNNAAIPLTGGSMAVMPYVSASPGTMHLMVDVSGYWAREISSVNTVASGPAYLAIRSCRLADGAVLSGNTGRAFTSPCGGGAQAIWTTLMVRQPTTGGHMVLYRSSDPAPPVSTVNFTAGRSIMNSTAVRVSPASPSIIAAYAAAGAGAANITIDQWAQFAPRESALDPMGYVPIPHCRALDTRNPEYGIPRTGDGYRYVTVRGNCGIPLDATAVRMNITVVNPESDGELYVNGTISGYVKAGEVISAGLLRRILAPPSNAVLPYENIRLQVLRPANTADPVADADFIADIVGYFTPVDQ